MSKTDAMMEYITAVTQYDNDWEDKVKVIVLHVDNQCQVNPHTYGQTMLQ